MRTLILATVSVICSCALTSVVAAQTPPPPQTARQALIEMFFGQSADHLQKHLPDVTRRSFQKMDTGNGQSLLTEFSMLASQAKAAGAGFQTFDTGPTIVTAEDPQGGTGEKVEVTVERDDLSGDEDQIELAFHMTRNGKEEILPFVPRFTFAMKMESDTWRLNEISVTVRLPLADPDFLKSLEDRQRVQNEQMIIWSVRSVNTAETTYKSVNGSFACDLATLGKAAKQGSTANGMYLYDPQLASGKKNGYVFVISSCDGSHYKIVGEPAATDSGQRSFCSDESGTIRASSDGKATTCLSSGEEVQGAADAAAIGVVGAAASPVQEQQQQQPIASEPPKSVRTITTTPASPQSPVVQRVRVSQAVTQSMSVSKVQPVYPPDARAARVQGSVVMAAIIAKDGSVQSLRVVSSASPMLEQAALDAVKQWKYRPYLLNGNPVEVDTQITVNFVLNVSPSN
jgi:TonB family protein